MQREAHLAEKRAAALAELAKKQDAMRQFGTTALEGFGFSVGTRIGTGSGGLKKEKQMGKAPGEAAVAPWKPNPACSEEQRQVLDEVMDNKNVFFTGSAGVGKSFLLNE